MTTNDSESALRSLVPAYCYPSDDPKQWRRLALAKPDSLGVVVNPHNGPGDAIDPEYARVVSALQKRGIPVYGYVDLDHGQKQVSTVLAQMWMHFEWYGISSIFLDQFPRRYHARVAHLLRLSRDRGVHSIVGNPGVVTDGSMSHLVDVLCTFEGDLDTYLLWEPSRRETECEEAHLVFAAPDDSIPTVQQLALDRGARWLALSPDSLPHPWGTFVLPSRTRRPARDLMIASR